MVAVYEDRAREHAAEIARHYYRSATMPGAERGVQYCLAAAEQAEQTAALTDVVDQLRAALDLLGQADLLRPRLLARLGLALVWAMRFDDAVVVASDAATRIAAAESPDAAADYLAEVVAALGEGGGVFHAAPLVREGLEKVGRRRDWTWAILTAYEIHLRETEDSTTLGVPLDTPERREVAPRLAAREREGS